MYICIVLEMCVGGRRPKHISSENQLTLIQNRTSYPFGFFFLYDMAIQKINPIVTFFKEGTIEGTYCTTTTNEEEDFIIESIAKNRERKALMGLSDSDIIKERANYFNEVNKQPISLLRTQVIEVTHLYLIINTKNGSLKVGKTKNLVDRLAQLNTASSDKLRYEEIKESLGYLEKGLHEKFKHLRKNGEWFEYSEEIVNYFRSL